MSTSCCSDFHCFSIKKREFGLWTRFERQSSVRVSEIFRSVCKDTLHCLVVLYKFTYGCRYKYIDIRIELSIDIDLLALKGSVDI